MGSTGPGNFETDAAQDFVNLFVEKVREEFCPPSEFEEIALVMGAVGVYLTLVDNCHATPPERAELQTLRERTLAVFDKEKHAFATDSNREHLADRRNVIADTFDRFLRLCGDG